MEHEPYRQFKREELVLRDYLAADRTALANERTLLSFIRTAVALAAGGVSLIHFLDSLAADIGGGLLLLLSALSIGFGLQRFIWYKRRLKHLLLK